MKLKLSGKKWICSFLAAVMLTTLVTSCRDDINNAEQEQVQSETVDIPNIPIIDEDVIDDEPVIEKVKEEKHADKIIIYDVKEVKELAEYTSIRYLKIDEANISDFSFLKDIDIEMLQVISNKYPIDLSCINSEAIQQVFFFDTQLENINAVKNFKNLTNYIMKSISSNNQITNLDFLSECNKLNKIVVENYAITNMDFAENLEEIVSVDIKNSAIEDISGLKNCNKLYELIITKSKVSDISVLRNFKDLEYVDLSNNYIKDVSPLEYANLYYLDLRDNFIQEINMLDKNNTLKNFDISKNYVSEFPINLVSKGIDMNLSYNNITNISSSDINILKNTAVSVNLFDNILPADTIKALSSNKGIYYNPVGGELNINDVIEYNERVNRVISYLDSDNNEVNLMKLSKGVMENCKIDFSLEAQYKDDAYGAIMEASVCTGMTEHFNSIARHKGIMAKEYWGDHGSATDNQRHVWSIVLIDNKWYHFDIMLSHEHSLDNNYPEVIFYTDNEMENNGYILDCNNSYNSNYYKSEEELRQIKEEASKNPIVLDNISNDYEDPDDDFDI